MVVFYDPNCGHCKEELPRLDSFYRAKWKAVGMTMLGVNIYDAEQVAWKKFVNEKNLKNWNENELPRMLRRHQSTVSMFYQKAKTSQSQNPLKILAAYYGRKSAIKDFVNDKIRANEELQSSSLT